MLSFALGSTGQPPERYSLRILFALSPSHQIDEDGTFPLGPYEARLRRDGTHYVLWVLPFPSESDARAFEEALRSAFLWLGVERVMGTAVAKTADVNVYPAPREIAEKSPFRMVAEAPGWTEIDGDYDDGYTVIVPEHLRLIRFGGGTGKVLISSPVARFGEDLRVAVDRTVAREIQLDERLQLAFEIYASSFFETGSNPRFIRLVTVLECLVAAEDATQLTREILSELRGSLKAKRDQHDRGTDRYNELDRLLGRLAGLKKESIGESMRAFIRTVATRHPSLGDPGELSGKVKSAYGVRSQLLHKGIAAQQEIESASAFLASFVPSLLKALALDGR